MPWRSTAVSLLFTFLLLGCAGKAKHADAIFFLPGVAGDGVWYNSLRDGLRDGGIQREVIAHSWGAPSPLFALNFSNEGIHNDAEKKLAKRVGEHIARFPNATVDLIGHSAGCGVILGALPRLPDGLLVGRVILLAPSVSPGYDLAPALARCLRMDVFVSDRDTTFLAWRTSNFGTYDRMKTKAAGNLGFHESDLAPEFSSKLTQHRFDESSRELGNDGSHFGATSREFVRQRIATLLR